MHRRIEWMDAAVSDLASISEHIERDRNVDTADRVTEAVHNAVQSLRTMPYRGRSAGPGVRKLVVPRLPYIIFYRVFRERVVIIAIVHAAQRYH